MKNYLKFLGLLIVTVFMSFSVKGEKMLVVIDAGHGGKDCGASVNEIMEKDITLAISRKIEELNKNSNVEIIFLRNNDQYLSLNDRIESVNNLKPDLLISIHVNKVDNKEFKGAAVYISNENQKFEKSEIFAKSFNNSLPGQLSQNKIFNANFYMLKNANCPAILLHLGNLNNENDRTYISSEKGQSEIAEKILSNLS